MSLVLSTVFAPVSEDGASRPYFSEPSVVAAEQEIATTPSELPSTLAVKRASSRDWVSALTMAQNTEDSPGEAERAEETPKPTKPTKTYDERDSEAIRKEVYSIQPPRVRLGGFGPRAPRFGREWGPSFMEAVEEALNFGSDSPGLLGMDWTESLLNIEAENTQLLLLRGLEIEADGGVRFNLDRALVLTEELSLRNH